MPGFETILPFLKPIEHLILDESVSEVMVNGPDQVFVEKAGFVEQVRGVSIGERSLLVAVKNIARRLGDDISEAKPGFAITGRQSRCGRHSSLQFAWCDAHHS